jgi:hypothetical protein
MSVLAAIALTILSLAFPGHAWVPAHAAGAGAAFVGLPPTRILDTRLGIGAVSIQPLGAGQTMQVQVATRGGVPSTATAVVMNVTVTDTTAASYLAVYPTGALQPLASNLNWVPGETIPNLVEVGLGSNGQVSVYNAAGEVDVIFDVAGYVAPNAPAGQGLYNPLVPARVMDTRSNGIPLGAGSTRTLQVTGNGGVPTNGAAAVVLNVTVTNASRPSYLTVYPSDLSQPVVSNLNFVAGQTIANRVIVRVSATGLLNFYNAAGNVDVIADVGGWFTDSNNAAASGSTFIPLTPSRVLDTRTGAGGFPISPLGPAQSIAVPVAGRGGVPAMTDPAPPNAVVANVTVTNTTSPSYLTLWPDGASQPLASDLNWVASGTIPNLVVVKLGGSGAVDLFNAAGCADVILDVVGYYTGPPVPVASTAITAVPSCAPPVPPPPPPPPPPPAADTCGASANPWGYNFCGSSAGNYIYNPPGNFCDYFACIPSFWSHTNGYVAECYDMDFSHSGGVQGACSYHGGVWRALWHP